MLLNRCELTHSLARCLGAGGLGLLLPSAALSEAQDTFNVFGWLEYAAAHLKPAMDQAAEKGARTISLSIYGQPRDPRYAAIMVPEPAPVAEERFLSLDAAALSTLLAQMTAKGWGPFILTATGPAATPLFAAVFRPITPAPLARHGLTADALKALNAEALKTNTILQCAGAYGTPQDIRYVATWHANTANAAWNCDALNDDARTAEQRTRAYMSGWARPAHVAGTPALGTLDLYADTSIGPTVVRRGLTRAQYEQEYRAQRARGLAPIQLSGYGDGSSRRYAAIFATRAQPYPRSFRMTGSPPVPQIDAAMEAIMQANQVRGASLALVQGTRLVYVKGYTWAEDDYPTTQPTTVFRQASVSKAFGAAAIYRLIEQRRLSFDTTLQSVLQLRTPTGGAPVDPRFATITIRNMLDMVSGIPHWVVALGPQVLQAFKSRLPITRAQLMSYIATIKLTGTPGDRSIAVYNSGDHFLLGEVAARVIGVPTVDEAVKRLVLDPLGITRIRASRSIIELQPPDEARYHPRPLATSISSMTPDQPLVLQGYGESNLENGVTAGALSGAAPDLARFVAALSVRKDNPFLPEATITTWLANAAAAFANNPAKAQGFHGWDFLGPVDVGKGRYGGFKGGGMITSENWIAFERDTWGYVTCFNGQVYRSGGNNALRQVLSNARRLDWGNVDLFPQYGMPAFARQ
jgi:CubicO group peptidase (beta-lactamase class C family)